MGCLRAGWGIRTLRRAAAAPPTRKEGRESADMGPSAVGVVELVVARVSNCEERAVVDNEKGMGVAKQAALISSFVAIVVLIKKISSVGIE